jgi:hypothetical protein
MKNSRPPNQNAPWSLGLTAMGIFLFFGAAMATLAGSTLTWRGTVLDRLWRLNPMALAQLAPLGKLAGLLFLLLAAVLAAAGIGWFRRRKWGWGLAVALIASQVIGNIFNALTGHLLEGGVGFAIAGALLLYLLRRNVRAAFS